MQTDKLDAHFDITLGLLVSGLTNVVTIGSGAGADNAYMSYCGLGIKQHKHGLGHGQDSDGKPANECLIEI